MFWRPALWVLALAIVARAEEEEVRTLHRLAGGHLRGDDKELATASAGDGKQRHKSDEEEKKTLSQQVADGKYGLIQKELFSKPAKKPGILSYEANPEVPTDNIKNLGGLQKNEIWLAENHLLVLKGGNYPETTEHAQSLWPPIDDYKAPQRQVKIPAHPKVPPPFPVQLEEGGPLQLLGTNTSTTLNGTFDAGTFAVPPPEGYLPIFPPLYPNQANATAGEAPYPIPPNTPTNPGEYYPGNVPPAAFPFPLNGTLPPYFASLPPGAAILPPPDNQTDYDEDDPSIYYPPPYSFFYPRDNSTEVPPGPLVPGIILPPPPDFFAPLEERKKTTYPTTIITTTTITTTTEPPQIHPTTTPIPPTSVIDSTPRQKVKFIPTEINNELNPTNPPLVVTVLPVRRKPTKKIQETVQRKKPTPSVTILKPVKDTKTPVVYYKENDAGIKPFAVYGPPEPVIRTVINTTQIPLRAYYTTANEIESNSVTEDPKVQFYSLLTKTTPAPPAQYYYYEETTKGAMRPSLPDPYINAQPTESPKLQEPKIYYVTARPRSTPRPKYRFVEQTSKPDSFKIHIARLRQQLQSYVTQRPVKPVYQYSFQAANYPRNEQYRKPKVQDDGGFRPIPKYSVQIQPAIEVIPSQQPSYENNRSPQVLRQYEFENAAPQRVRYVNPGRQYLPQQQQQPYIVTPQPVAQYAFEPTPNPLYQNYYTKPDEKYVDDITKKYFTIFGKKITTPLPPTVQSTTAAPENPIYVPQNAPVPYNSKPISLESDTLVNYVHPRPNINPDAEYIVQKSNYVRSQPIKATNTQTLREPVDGKSGSYISYQLPGDDGAHFYFLTPQLVQRTDQGSGFYFSQRRKRDERER